MSSPGMYARCSAKSVDAPRCGDRCRPLMKPSTTVRAINSRFPIRARIVGSRKDVAVSGATAVMRWIRNAPLHPALRHWNSREETIDDLIRGHLLRLGVEVGQHAMAEHRLGERANVLEADVEASVHQRTRLT